MGRCIPQERSNRRQSPMTTGQGTGPSNRQDEHLRKGKLPRTSTRGRFFRSASNLQIARLSRRGLRSPMAPCSARHRPNLPILLGTRNNRARTSVRAWACFPRCPPPLPTCAACLRCPPEECGPDQMRPRSDAARAATRRAARALLIDLELVLKRGRLRGECVGLVHDLGDEQLEGRGHIERAHGGRLHE